MPSSDERKIYVILHLSLIQTTQLFLVHGKKIRIAINGFGRIGRAAFKIALTKKNIEIVAVNDLADAKTLAHLLKYDSIYGTYRHEVLGTKSAIVVDKTKYPVFAKTEPATL